MGTTVSSFLMHQQSHFQKWTILELLSVAFLCTLLTWYLQFLWKARKIYHHSSKLPGPLALPLIGSALHFIGSPEDIFSTIMKMFSDYPGIFRVWFGSRMFYAISDPRYYEILLPNCLRKEPLYGYAEPVVGHGLFTAPLDKWRKHRKAIMPTFNQKILNGFVEIFSERSRILTERLKEVAGGGDFDIYDVMSRCTLNIICETAMGVEIQAESTENNDVATWIDNVMETIFLRIFLVWYHIDIIFNLTRRSKEFWTSVKNLHHFSGTVVRKKKRLFDAARKMKTYSQEFGEEEGSRKKIFLDYLIEITGEGDARFTEKELRDEVDTFIIAGSDTTASTNSFIFIMLGLHKDLQEKVYEEILEVVGPDGDIEAEDLPKLKYLERFIKETLRLFPVGGFIARTIDTDIDLGDRIVPGGVSVIFGILSTHTNEKYWPDPYKFDPDRFLPEEIAKRHPCAYIPFSYGPRNCLGARYAMMAMKTILATVVRKFKVSTSYRSVQDIKLKTNLVLRPTDGYMVSLELR